MRKHESALTVAAEGHSNSELLITASFTHTEWLERFQQEHR